MKKIILFKKSIVLLCLISIGAYGQNQSKTFRESFNVDEDAVLEINTSHADIEFETWDKNEVVIEATIELEDISDEEADRYFERNPVKIMGNSQKIEISTGRGNSRFASNTFENLDFHSDMPVVGPLIIEMPELSVFPEVFEMEEMPPMPPMNIHKFDYEAYKKDGKEYMKKWQKEFTKGFDEEYEKKMEEWGARMEKRAEKMMERREKLKARAEERAERGRERAEKIQEKRILIMQESDKMRKRRDSTRFLLLGNDSLNFGGPNIFYFNSDGREGNIKVKKTIKVKMPKSVKLKMNVRHGEVKLAKNTKDLKATLSHARLLATNIEGDDTTIIASYSPVSVQNWNYGQLQTDYSENVDLKQVRNLILRSTSSDITIDRLLSNLSVDNSFGPIRIKSISKNFEDMDVSLRNAELTFELPNTAFDILVNGTSSKLTTPLGLNFSKTKNGPVVVNQGYHLKKNSNKSIKIDSKYSEVVVH